MSLNQQNYYDDTEYLSHSQLEDFIHCPYFYNVKYITKEYEQDEEVKKYFVIGSAVDVILTEPEKYNDQFFAGDLRKMSEEEKTANESKTRLTPADEVMVTECVNELERQPLYHQFVGDGWENQVILTGEAEGIKLKGKLDKMHKRNKIIIDIKTTRDIISFKPEQYATQLAYYRMLAGKEFTCYIIAVDKYSEFKRSCIYRMSGDILDIAEYEILAGVKSFKESKESGLYVPVSSLDESQREAKCYSCPFYSLCEFSEQKTIKTIM
jgi:hypothetical protein